MLHEKRRNRIRLLAYTAPAAKTSRTPIALGDILLTNGDTIDNRDCVTLFQRSGVDKALHTGNRQKQTIALLSPKFQRLNVPLLRIKITTGRITIFILTSQEVILLGELHSQLTVYGEVNSQLVRIGSKIHDYRVSETFSTKQAVSVGVLSQIADFSDIRTIHLHLSFDFIRC